MVPGLPDTSRTLLARLLEEPLVPAGDLSEMVAIYRRVIQDSEQAGLPVNAPLGLALADTLDKVLALVDDRVEPEALLVIQVAVLYFVIEYDGFGHDLHHEDGLFGDARVVNAMLRWFGLDALAVPLPAAAAERRPASDAGGPALPNP
jgi:hypothetical protein